MGSPTGRLLNGRARAAAARGGDPREAQCKQRHRGGLGNWGVDGDEPVAGLKARGQDRVRAAVEGTATATWAVVRVRLATAIAATAAASTGTPVGKGLAMT